MTTIYADTVLVTNFCVDYLLLFATAKYMNMKVRMVRLLLSAFLGAVFSLMCAFIHYKRLLITFFSIVFVYVLCRVCFGDNKRIVVKSAVVFFLMSITLCGLSMFLFLTLYGAGTSEKNGFAVTAFSAVIVLVFLRYGSKNFCNKSHGCNKKVVIMHKGFKEEYIMFCDSGNFLTDPYFGYPVIVIKESEKSKIVKDENLRLMPVVTATGQGLLEVFIPDKVYVGENHVTASVCFARDENIDICDCDGIVPGVLAV